MCIGWAKHYEITAWSCICIHTQSHQMLIETFVWKCPVWEAREERGGRFCFLLPFAPRLLQVLAVPLLISTNEFTNQYCQQKNRQPEKQARAPQMLFTASYLLLSRERTNSTQCCNNQPLSLERQMVLIGSFTRWGQFHMKTAILSLLHNFNSAFSIMLQA